MDTCLAVLTMPAQKRVVPAASLQGKFKESLRQLTGREASTAPQEAAPEVSDGTKLPPAALRTHQTTTLLSWQAKYHHSQLENQLCPAGEACCT